jgi:phosphoglycerate dehydrogenase-like enzyme
VKSSSISRKLLESFDSTLVSVDSSPLYSRGMSNDTLLVLADSDDAQLNRLKTSLAGVQIVVGNAPEAFEKAAPNASVLLNWSGSLELFRSVFAMCRNLRWVHSRSAGLDKALFPELVESSVPLTNGRGVFSASLGEFVAGAILYFAKDFRRMIRNQAAGVWEPFDIVPVSGQTAGIVGYGDIGRATAERIRPLGMTILALKRRASQLAAATDPLVEKMYGPEQRTEMLARCDYVVVATPLTPETQGTIGAPEFVAMKPTAVVINVGRGPVIDEIALIDALSSGRIKGAALDVFDEEPLPEGHPFYKLENVLLSPHCADHTPDWLDNAMQFFLEQFQRYRKGELLLNVVDKKSGY